MGRIQTGYMDFLPLQVCERSWKFCRLSVQTCLLQFISFLDLKYPSSYLFKTFFVDFDLCVSYVLRQSSFILKLVLGCVRKLSVGRIQNRHTDLLSPRFVGVCEEGTNFLSSPVIINWLTGFKSIIPSYSSF